VSCATHRPCCSVYKLSGPLHSSLDSLYILCFTVTRGTLKSHYYIVAYLNSWFQFTFEFTARSSFQALRLEKEKMATRENADVSGNDADQRKDPRRRNSKVRSTPRVISGPSESSRAVSQHCCFQQKEIRYAFDCAQTPRTHHLITSKYITSFLTATSKWSQERY
jgi:hypothetical protein